MGRDSTAMQAARNLKDFEIPESYLPTWSEWDTLPGIPGMDTSIQGDFREIEINLHRRDLPQRVDLWARKRRYCELGETSSEANETVDADFKFLTGTVRLPDRSSFGPTKCYY